MKVGEATVTFRCDCGNTHKMQVGMMSFVRACACGKRYTAVIVRNAIFIKRVD